MKYFFFSLFVFVTAFSFGNENYRLKEQEWQLKVGINPISLIEATVPLRMDLDYGISEVWHANIALYVFADESPTLGATAGGYYHFNNLLNIRGKYNLFGGGVVGIFREAGLKIRPGLRLGGSITMTDVLSFWAETGTLFGVANSMSFLVGFSLKLHFQEPK